MKLPPPTTVEDYTTALAALEKMHPITSIEIPTAHLFVIIGALQLAMRHPNFPKTSRQILTSIIKQIRDGLNEPVLMRAIDQGFDERYDQ